jgi:hypothetical protein
MRRSSMRRSYGYGSAMQRALLVMLVVPVLLAACGGDDRGPRLTKAEFASKADAICEKYNKQAESLDRPNSLTELADVADNTIPILRNAINEWRKLNPPQSEADTVDEWIGSVEQLVGDLEEIRDQADKGSMQGVQKVVPQADQHNRRTNELATQLGMTVCNQN